MPECHISIYFKPVENGEKYTELKYLKHLSKSLGTNGRDAVFVL